MTHLRDRQATVWDALTDIPFDVKSFEDRFGAVTTTKASSVQTPTEKTKPSVVSLLDPRRSNAVAVTF